MIDLMAPRLKLILDYPYCDFEVGQIITLDKKTPNGMYWHEYTEEEPLHILEGEPFYPGIFQPLPWWSERRIEDMPDFIKWKDEIAGDTPVIKISEFGKWENCNYIKWNRGGGLLISGDEQLPSTESEYLQYKAKQK